MGLSLACPWLVRCPRGMVLCPGLVAGLVTSSAQCPVLLKKSTRPQDRPGGDKQTPPRTPTRRWYSSALIRFLPLRVGFAERDASRPAFGGSSLVSRTRHTCVGGDPLGPRLYVRHVRPKKSATTPALSEKKQGGFEALAKPRGVRSPSGGAVTGLCVLPGVLISKTSSRVRRGKVFASRE